MSSRVRRWLHRAVPAHFQDPFGLTWRLLRSRHPAAYFAMASAGLGLAATPIDWMLRAAEQRRYDGAPPRSHPLIFVCGPPRSGTTLVASTLLAHLPVAYFTNWTAIFPRAPLVASEKFQWLLRGRRVSQRNYYGRTAHFSGPNDALHLWDRWLGSDRERLPDELPAEARAAMVAFFAAWESSSGRPLLNKCNNVNAVAHLVGAALEDSFFLCLEREPLYLAQSLLRAREEIHGDRSVPYGLTDPDRSARDPVESVCDQVRYHRRLGERQLERLGAGRFWRVSYEGFCRAPAALVGRVASEILGLDRAEVPERIEPIEPSMSRRIDRETWEALAAALGGQ